MSSPLKILLVEDEFLIALDLEQILQDAGHTVCGIASSSSEALRIANSEHPDLALVDVNLLDGRSGVEIARKFVEIGHPCAVFITANAVSLPPALYGAAGVIHKPYAPDDLVHVAAYLAEGILAPPPKTQPPRGLHLSPDMQKRWS